MKKRVLVLGASGMLGSAVMKVFSSDAKFDVFGSVRSRASCDYFSKKIADKLVIGYDVEDYDQLIELMDKVRPDFVINCVGLVKQLSDSNDPLRTIPINSILPHRLARVCDLIGSRLIHVSTDCVFSGGKGGYLETDTPDAEDLYGRSKLLGEVDYPNAVTLRTSIIGHELNGARSLIDWFLSQNGVVKGYKRAVFSGLPTFELAKVIKDYVVPRDDLRGLYHVSSDPINKYDLLSLVRDVYRHAVEVVEDEALILDRSLNSSRFRKVTGYVPDEWPLLIQGMNQFYQVSKMEGENV